VVNRHRTATTALPWLNQTLMKFILVSHPTDNNLISSRPPAPSPLSAARVKRYTVGNAPTAVSSANSINFRVSSLIDSN
jgi:hypothetical protein